MSNCKICGSNSKGWCRCGDKSMDQSNEKSMKKKGKKMEKDKYSHYPKTDSFEVIDSLGVPHPYCIGSAHVAYASDNWSGMLGKEAIIEAEKRGKAHCMIKGCNLSYEQHEQALLINCKIDDNGKLKAYLLSIKDLATKEGYAGFAFKKGW